MNTQTQQRQLVAVAALITLAVGVITSIQKNGGMPSTRFWVGYGFAFAVTSIMADLGLAIGAAFALIIMVGTILENSETILDWMEARGAGVGAQAGKGKKPGATSPSKPPPPGPLVPRFDTN